MRKLQDPPGCRKAQRRHLLHRPQMSEGGTPQTEGAGCAAAAHALCKQVVSDHHLPRWQALPDRADPPGASGPNPASVADAGSQYPYGERIWITPVQTGADFVELRGWPDPKRDQILHSPRAASNAAFFDKRLQIRSRISSAESRHQRQASSVSLHSRTPFRVHIHRHRAFCCCPNGSTGRRRAEASVASQCEPSNSTSWMNQEERALRSRGRFMQGEMTCRGD